MIKTMEETKIMFCIMGKSAVGKDTVINNVTTIHHGVSKIIPTTTRPMRAYEKNGHDYFFITANQFIKRIENEQFMEYRHYDVVKENGKKDTWYYGTVFPKQQVSVCTGSFEMYEHIINNPKVKDNIKVYPIYITVPEDERLYRMIRREHRNKTPNYREVARRYIQDNVDFSAEKCQELGITAECTFTNIDRDKVVRDICNYIDDIMREEGLI